MSMYNALDINVQGIMSQSHNMGNISNNIANASTNGFKSKDTGFEWIIIGGDYNGGARAYDINTLHLQGPISSSDINTHIAVEGQGMLVVSSNTNNEEDIMFTRSGSFSKDKDGNLANNEGMFLKAWKLDNSNVNKGTLETVNVKDIGMNSIKTSNIFINMNLDAEQQVQHGAKQSIEIINNTGRDLDVDSIIISENLNTGDSIEVSMPQGIVHKFTYGGIQSSSKMLGTENAILGASKTLDNFSALEEGDAFIINTPSTGSVAFKYQQESPNPDIGQFNNLESLSYAINSVNGLTSRVADNQLHISPQLSGESITFSNQFDTKAMGKSSDISKALGIKPPRSEIYSLISGVSSSIYGAENANQIFNQVIADGDGISITLSNLDEFQFRYTNASTPDTQAGYFNSLSTLSEAINNLSSVRSSIVNNNQMHLSSNENSIISIKSTGLADVAKDLGIKLDSSFLNIKEGDGMRISTGSYKEISSSTHLDDYSKFNSISSIDTSNAFDFHEVNTSFSSFKDMDGFSITLSNNATPIDFVYVQETPQVSLGQFNSFQSLHDALNSNIKLQSSFIDKAKKINISTLDDNISINSIANTGGGKSNIATKLGIEFTPLNIEDSFNIQLDNGKEYSFIFAGENSVNPLEFEFNNLVGLADIINYATEGNIEANIIDGALKLEVNHKSPSNINKVYGKVAEQLKMNRKSDLLDLTYTSIKPDISLGEFNDTQTLLKALKNNGVLEAKLDKEGKELTINTKNNSNIKFISNANEQGNSNVASALGLRKADIVGSLGLKTTESSIENTFSNIRELSRLISNSEGMSANIKDDYTIEIYPDSIASSIEFTNSQHNTQGKDMLTALGIEDFSRSSPKYLPEDSNKNIASGTIRPDYSHDFVVYDSLGSAHTMQAAFIKLNNNQWSMEIFVKDMDDIITAREDGLIGFSALDFDGNGNLLTNNFISLTDFRSTSDSMSIKWSNGANSSDIKINLEDIDGKSPIASGITQISSDYRINYLDQDGCSAGDLNNISIDREGHILANFSNGTTRKIYKIPVAEFPNPNGLRVEFANAYSKTIASGDFILQEPGSGRAGFIRPAAIEGSNTNIYQELFRLIEVKHRMQSNIKALNTTDKMLEEVSR